MRRNVGSESRAQDLIDCHVIGSMATQNAGTGLPDSSRACCRCNRNGRCRNCFCCKGRRRCVSCLTGRLGRCENYGASSAYDSEDNPTDSENDNDVLNDASPSSSSESLSNYSANVGVADVPSCSFSFLPPFNVMCAPNFIWGDVPGESFVHSVTCCYDEAVHWRKVLFRIPQAKCGSISFYLISWMLYVFVVLLLSSMALLVPQDWMLQLGDVCALLFRQFQMIYVMLCQLLPGVYAPHLWILLAYPPLLLVA